MSTVVGTCADCIVSLPPQPTHAVNLRIQTNVSDNLVIRETGAYQQSYANAQSTDLFVSIAASGNYAIPSGTQFLFLRVSSPVAVTAVVAGVSMTFNVNTFLVLDTSYDAIQVTNPSTTSSVLMNLVYIPTA
jgi:hypothetical protein